MPILEVDTTLSKALDALRYGRGIVRWGYAVGEALSIKNGEINW